MSPQEIKELADALKISMDLQTTSQWSSYIPIIIGAIIGAIASIATSIVPDLFKSKRHQKSLQNSFISEITSILEIIDARSYIQTFEEIIEHLQTMEPGATYPLKVEVASHYSRIYQNNASHIGLIDENLAPKIVRFHHLLDSVVQDVKSNGAFPRGTTIDSYQQTLTIFRSAYELGKDIITTKAK